MSQFILRLFQPRTSDRRHSTTSQKAWREENRNLDDALEESRPVDQRTAFVSIIDKNGFNRKVFLVASSGFFTDSYNLFASNVILPALAFVYWGHDHGQSNEININISTLAGSCVGQVLFGFLADICGRQRLYGVELIIVIFATLGFAASGPGLQTEDATSMSISSWLMFWKFVMGVGIGAEYPLSAAITIEWAAIKSRARMMSAVFLMQPLGQLCAYGVGLAVLHGLNNLQHYDFKQDGTGQNPHIGIDKLWRIVTGVGCVPAIIALIFRWTIPESGRYTSDIRLDADAAYTDTEEGLEPLRTMIWNLLSNKRSTSKRATDFGSNADQVEGRLDNDPAEKNIRTRDFALNQLAYQHDTEVKSLNLSQTEEIYPNSTEGMNDGIVGDETSQSASESYQTKFAMVGGTRAHEEESDEDDSGIVDDRDRAWSQFTRKQLHRYFIKDGNWRYLLGACVCWFFLDLPFYGLGFNNPGTLAKLWTAHRVDSKGTTPAWLLNSAAINVEDPSIFSALNHNGIEAIATVAVWSLLGCALMTWRIKFIDRRHTLIWTSILLALLLLTIAILFPFVFHKPGHSWLIVLYAIIQVFFSFGPNTLIFIIVAEIFPTRYRCTAYGIAAASGKLGAVVVQLIYRHFAVFALKDPNSNALGHILYLFAACMVVVALAAWWFIPNVQERGSRAPIRTIFGTSYVVKNKTLEHLAEGRANEPEPEKVGLRNRTKVFVKRITDKFGVSEDD